MPSGSGTGISMTVKPKATLTPGKKLSCQVKATSDADASARDVAAVNVVVK